MRLDELPRSDKVEVQHHGRLSTGRVGGLGIGTVLSSVPRLGVGHQSPPLDRRGGDFVRHGRLAAAITTHQGRASGPSLPIDNPLVSAMLGSTEVPNGKIFFTRAGETYRLPNCTVLPARRARRVGSPSRLWAYCRTIRRSISTPHSFQDLKRAAFPCLRRRRQGLPLLQAYVISHEIGHHVQNLLVPRVQEAQRGMDQAEANELQVRVKLQANCLAGVWAHHARPGGSSPAMSKSALPDPRPIGDDRLQRQRSAGVPDAFTHGSSQQRTPLVPDRAEVGGGCKLRYIPGGAALIHRVPSAGAGSGRGCERACRDSKEAFGGGEETVSLRRIGRSAARLRMVR